MDLQLFTNKDFLIAKHHQLLGQTNTSAIKANGMIRSTILSGLPRAHRQGQVTQSNRVTIRDLIGSVNVTLVGKHFLCRNLVHNALMSSLHMVVDDPEGELGVRLCLYNYTDITRPNEDVIPVGTLMAIMNPLFKITADGGFSVRCDNPAEVVLIERDAGSVSTWMSLIPELYLQMGAKSDRPAELKVKSCSAESGCKNSDEWKILGNKYFKEQKYDVALEAYSSGLALSPIHIDLLSNRSLVNIKLDNFKGALQDADALLSIQPKHGKALYRKSLALIGLRKYEDAVSFLGGYTPEQMTVELSNLRKKLQQQLSGDYDMNYFLHHAKDQSMKTYPGCAEYCAKVNLVKIYKKGRGLVSVNKIAAGQLVMVSKAFSFQTSKEEEDLSITLNMETKRFFGSNHRNLVYVTTQKLKNNPDLCKELYNLYAGPELGHLDAKEAEACTDLDIKRIDLICGFNSFTGDGSGKDDTFTSQGTSGVWLQPSYLNHSCVNYNALWLVKKDFMFVRAMKEIAEGEEITIPYLPLNEDYKNRLSHLQSKDFECDCDLCQLEKNEPEAVHGAREFLIKGINDFPNRVRLSKKQINKLKQCRKQLEKLRPNSKFNFALVSLELTLSSALMFEGEYLEAADSLQKAFSITAPYCQLCTVTIAANCITAYLFAGEKEEAIKWIPKWKEQLRLVYGSENVNLFLNTKESLKAHGIQF